MMLATVARRLLVIAVLVVWPHSTANAEPVFADVGLTVLNQERMSDTNQGALYRFLSGLPRLVTENMTCLSVDQPPSCPTIDPSGTLHGVNIISWGDDVQEDPWPSDLPPPHVTMDVFLTVAAHEIGHQIHTTVAHQRGMQAWADRLIAEAGCPPVNYLRSQGFPDCFYRDVPQEFVAAFTNQWFASSRDVLRLAVHRFRGGNAHPMDQAIFLLPIFGTNRPAAWNQHESQYGTVWAYRYDTAYRAPRVEVWQVFPWRCPGRIQITGPDFSLGLETVDIACHVGAIVHAEGLE